MSEDASTLDEMLDDIAAKYLAINCACFTPNQGRLDDIARMAKDLGADGVIDYTLQFCGLYEIESTAVEQTVRDAGLPVHAASTRSGSSGARPSTLPWRIQGSTRRRRPAASSRAAHTT